MAAKEDKEDYNNSPKVIVTKNTRKNFFPCINKKSDSTKNVQKSSSSNSRLYCIIIGLIFISLIITFLLAIGFFDSKEKKEKENTTITYFETGITKDDYFVPEEPAIKVIEPAIEEVEPAIEEVEPSVEVVEPIVVDLVKRWY